MRNAQATRYSADALKRPTTISANPTADLGCRLALTAALGGAALFAALARARPERLRIRGHSMEPYLADGDRVVVVRARRVRPGDVVAIPDPRQPQRTLVKRVAQILPEGLYVLGDNPNQSTDSRQFGLVPASPGLRRAIYRYYPPERAAALRPAAPRRPAALKRAATNAPCTARASAPNPRK